MLIPFPILHHNPTIDSSSSIPTPEFNPTPHITVQGIGIQQHSYPSHSIHFVFPAPASPLTSVEIVEDAAEPGPLRFMSWVGVEVHIFCLGGGLWFGGRGCGLLDGFDCCEKDGRVHWGAEWYLLCSLAEWATWVFERKLESWKVV